MADASFRPVFYLKDKCPFCMKVRIFLLEAGLWDEVEIREVVPGTPEEQAIRAELEPKLEKVGFPAAQTEPGRYMTDSDGIIAHMAGVTGKDPAAMPVLRASLDGPFQQIMTLYRENTELKKQLEA